MTSRSTQPKSGFFEGPWIYPEHQAHDCAPPFEVSLFAPNEATQQRCSGVEEGGRRKARAACWLAAIDAQRRGSGDQRTWVLLDALQRSRSWWRHRSARVRRLDIDGSGRWHQLHDHGRRRRLDHDGRRRTHGCRLTRTIWRVRGPVPHPALVFTQHSAIFPSLLPGSPRFLLGQMDKALHGAPCVRQRRQAGSTRWQRRSAADEPAQRSPRSAHPVRAWHRADRHAHRVHPSRCGRGEHPSQSAGLHVEPAYKGSLRCRFLLRRRHCQEGLYGHGCVDPSYLGTRSSLRSMGDDLGRPEVGLADTFDFG